MLRLAALLLVPSLAVAAEPAVRLQRDITYATADTGKLQLDLVSPAGPGPHPCVVVLHGGGWKAGSRRDMHEMGKFLAGQGFAAATVSYRLAPKNKWPAQIEDAKTAVRFLKSQASQLGLDPARFAALGFSAGGHLAALLGTADKAAGFEGTLYPDQSSGVRCVVDYYGPADLTLYTESPGIEEAFFVPFLGKPSKLSPDLYKLASPLAHVSKASAPFLIVHGTADVIVPILHSERLHKRLTEAGVKSELVTVPGSGHGWDADLAATTSKVVRFLRENLAK